MKRYAEEIKTQALAKMNSIGVKKTSEEMGLSIQTLYKWRNEGKAPSKAKEQGKGNSAELLQLIKADDNMAKKIEQLEEENTQLRKTVSRLKKALAAMID